MLFLRRRTFRAKKARLRRVFRPVVELLEGRLAPSAVPPTFSLDPQNDEYGAQVQTVTQFGDPNRVVLGILDTGASAITVAPEDQAGFADTQLNLDPIPVKVPGGASGDGIGGTVAGDVSVPITVLTDGLHAATVNFDDNFNLTIAADFNATSAKANGIQTFIGTDVGSPGLPTISGTPIFAGGFNSASRSKLAAKVDLINGVDLYGLGLLEPDVHFVPSTSKLVPSATEFLTTVPLGRIGDNTALNPGSDISSYFNFLSNSVGLNNTSGGQVYSVADQQFLLDTGSQLTIISTAEANQLHIDLTKPFDSIDVQGVGGTETIDGYVIDSLQVGVLGTTPLTIKNVPVFVLDAVPGLDGILGMNLWNNADQMLINPFTPFGATTRPTLSITWDPNYNGSLNLGAFGFTAHGFVLGHKGPSTLTDMLGAAAQYFKVPHPNHVSLVVPSPVRPAAVIASTLTAMPPTSAIVTLENASYSTSWSAAWEGNGNDTAVVTISNPSWVPVQWMAPIAAAANSKIWDGENGDKEAIQPLGDSFIHGNERAAPEGEKEPQYPTNLRDRGEESRLLPAEPIVIGATNLHPMVLAPQNSPGVEAVLLAALVLVVDEYWVQELTERHFQAKIRTRRRTY